MRHYQHHTECQAPSECSCACFECAEAYREAGHPPCRRPEGRLLHEDCPGNNGIVEFKENGATVLVPSAAPAGVPGATSAPARPAKHDTGKPPLARIFVLGSALDAVARTLTYGHGKYGDDVNWQKVEQGEARYLSAAVRHISKHVQGRLHDDEPDEQGRPGSGLPHLWHAACSLLMALWHADGRLRGASRKERDG